MIYVTQIIPYFNNTGGISNASVVANGKATIKGIDFNFALRATPDWFIGGELDYADGKIQGPLPCNNGVLPSAGPGNAIHFCNNPQPTSFEPRWGATLQSEYDLTVAQDTQAYLRGLFNYKPANNDAATDFSSKAYALLNLYAGVRSVKGDWDVSLFAKNITNTQVQLTQSPPIVIPGGAGAYFGNPASTGYSQATQTPEREFGFSIRHSWGAR